MNYSGLAPAVTFPNLAPTAGKRFTDNGRIYQHAASIDGTNYFPAWLDFLGQSAYVLCPNVPGAQSIADPISSGPLFSHIKEFLNALF